MAARARSTEGQAAPKSDVYTGMLVVSLLAQIIACVFLYLDFSRYPDTKPPTTPPKPPALTPSGPAPGTPPAGQ